MSVLQEFWVKPNLPTVLGDVESLHVKPSDLIFCSMDFVWIYPGPLDIERLKFALAKTLHDNPHVAGRLERRDDDFYINLSSPGVPLRVATSQEDPTEDFLQIRHPDAVDSIAFEGNPNADPDEPLLTLRVTTWEKTGETSLGMAWLHLLGDGKCNYRFMHSIQQYYLDLEPEPAPTFEKYFDPEPVLERTLIQESLSLVPKFAIDYTLEDFYPMYEEFLTGTSQINLQFSAEQLSALRAAVSAKAGVRVSIGDAFSGYLISVLSRISPVPIQKIINTVEYRGVGSAPGSSYKPPGLLATGNNFLSYYSEKVPPNAFNSVGFTAPFIRKTLEAGRDPEYIRRVVALSSELIRRTYSADRFGWYFAYEDTAVTNNLHRMPFTSCHFGYEGKTRFYTYHGWPRYFRIWPGNPERLPDGSWQSNEGSARVFFRLKDELKPLYLKAVEDDMRNLIQGTAKL